MTYGALATSCGRSIADFLLRWGEMLEASSYPALVADLRTGEIRLCNAAARRRLGDCPPRTLVEALPHDDRRKRALLEARSEGRGEYKADADAPMVVVAIGGLGEAAEGVYVSLPAEPPRSTGTVFPSLVAAMIDASDDAFLGVDASGAVVYANHVARRVLGEGLVGRFLAGVAPPAALLAASTGDGGAQTLEAADGTRRALHWRSASLRLDDGVEIRGVWGRDITEAHEAQLRLALRMRRVDSLHEIALAMGRGGPVQPVAQLALARLETLLPVREGRVSLLEGDTLRSIAIHRDGAPQPSEGRTLLSASPAEEARIRRGPVQVPISAAARYPSLRALEPLGIRAALYVPLQVEEAIFGFLELYGDVRERFSEEETGLAAQVASMIAAAMVRERLLEQVARHAHAMEVRVAMRNEELNRTQEQLIQAAKLSSIGELAAGLVHELNQPLNVIGGYVELLTEGGLPEPARARALDVMGRAVARMSTMVENLRNFSRSGGPSLTPVDLADVARMARELTAGAHKRGVEIEAEPDVVVLGDATRLEQVLINLIANAMQIDGDPVVVRVRAGDGERGIVEVADRGPGVPEQLRERIFDAFFTTKPPGQGTGLGLSVSARIVQEHGGRIEVGDNPGGGALFRVVLPLYRPGAAGRTPRG